MKAAIHAACVVVALASCTHDRPRARLGPPPALPEQRQAMRFAPLPEWYWEPVEADIHASPQAIELPLAESLLVRVEGATRIWDELGVEGRERLRRDGLVVPGNDGTAVAQAHMGAFYMDARMKRVPYVVTLDALAYALHLAFERALAEVDETVLAPELELLITKLEVRLAAEQKGAGVEIGEALRLARGIVAVARGLASDGASRPAADLGPVVQEEIARIVAHVRPAPSVLLGTTIDYARFAVPSGAARPGAFRALAWLASAPLVLVAQSEVPGASVGVGAARLHARTAMLLARFSEREVDAGIHAAWSRIARLLTFLWGPSDDLAPPELTELASAMAVKLEDPKHIASVVTVDKLRHRAAQGRAPLVFDGTGSAGRAGIAMRLFGGHAPADSIALGLLVGTRGLPSTLDLAAWMGAPEARGAIRETGGDGSAGYDAALAKAITARPTADAPSRHASVHGSLLDAVMTWLVPAEGAPRALASPAAQRASIESALAMWTYARHADQPLTRARPTRAPFAVGELHVTGAALPAFIEPTPEVIARLVATLGQMRRGLAAIGGVQPASPAMTVLVEVDDLLRAALRVASRQVNDEALNAEDLAVLASLPARLARLEESENEMVPVVAEVFADPRGERVLSSATGSVEPALMIVREPGTGRLLLAVGAHVAHHELVEARGERSTDATYRSRFRGEAQEKPPTPPRAVYTSAFRVVVP
jgi:hypothetical protein